MKDLLQDRRILVTGGAGFIGSHLVEALASKSKVTVLDDLSAGKQERLPSSVRFVRGGLTDAKLLGDAMREAEIVFHLAALPSVARSLVNPLQTHEVNATGTLRVLEAARKGSAQRVIFAGSSSAYGDSEVMPKHEGIRPDPLSPYAASKLAAESYMRAYAKAFGMQTVTLRYFNVYGPRQQADSAYAAVVPRFLTFALQGRPVPIEGTGQQTRDFTYVDDVVRANLLAVAASVADGQPINIAGGSRITILELVAAIERLLGRKVAKEQLPERPGDIRDSFADLSRAKTLLGYEPQVHLDDGLRRTFAWIKHAVATTVP